MLLVGCVKQAPVVEEDTGITLAPEPTPEPAPTYDVVVSLAEWTISPARLTADAGKVTFKINNNGNYYHEFMVKGDGMNAMLNDGIEAEGSAELTVELEPGTYKVIDPIPGNEAKGLVAELVVS